MHRGFMKMVEFIFSEGYTNIRAILKKNNNLEIENEVASFNVSFFITHMDSNIIVIKKLYYYLVDLMQLSNFIEILSHAAKPAGGKILADASSS